MLGLALEGGGARGAYQIGVIKAYLENGYVFDGFVGTSIGAINAAVLAQGDFEKAFELWSALESEHIFDANDAQLIRISEIKLNMNYISNLRKCIKKVIRGGGIDTSKMKTIISEVIDEQKIRSSSKNFGLVTVSLSERKPYELFTEDIPQGKLINYLMASAAFPGFKPEHINGHTFIDGGVYNNCPINMLIDKGYDEIVAVRTLVPGRFRRVVSGEVKLKIIAPNENLGNMMLFSRDQIQANIRIGYSDGMRAIKKRA